jgi:hypothetical protein
LAVKAAAKTAEKAEADRIVAKKTIADKSAVEKEPLQSRFFSILKRRSKRLTL